jgi:hypothetical protein
MKKLKRIYKLMDEVEDLHNDKDARRSPDPRSSCFLTLVLYSDNSGTVVWYNPSENRFREAPVVNDFDGLSHCEASLEEYIEDFDRQESEELYRKNTEFVKLLELSKKLGYRIQKDS